MSFPNQVQCAKKYLLTFFFYWCYNWTIIFLQRSCACNLRRSLSSGTRKRPVSHALRTYLMLLLIIVIIDISLSAYNCNMDYRILDKTYRSEQLYFSQGQLLNRNRRFCYAVYVRVLILRSIYITGSFVWSVHGGGPGPRRQTPAVSPVLTHAPLNSPQPPHTMLRGFNIYRISVRGVS